AGHLDVPKTKITGNQQNEEHNLAFTAVHKDTVLININSQISGTSKELRFHVLPDSLILDKNVWQIPETNQVIWTKNKITFNDFRFTRDGALVALIDKLSDRKQDQVSIEFQNLKLSEILNYLNPEEELAKGHLNGNLSIVEPFGKMGILADLLIEN